MGSGSKKHKKERDSKKHKHKSRSRSPRYSPEVRIVRDSEKEPLRRHHHKHRGERESRSRSPARAVHRSRSRERSKERRHHHHHKKHKERKHRHKSRSAERTTQEDYHSDSSDVVEVPLAPPPPVISKDKTRSPSPIPQNGAGDCLSIEETNKLRAKLGLKPLEVESSVPAKVSSEKKNEEGLSAYKDEWGEFLHKPAEHIGEKAEADKMREKLKQRKEKRQLEDKLKKIKTLGESDDEVDDISKWMERSKHKDHLRREAARRAKMLEEMDAEFGVGNIVEEENQKRKRHAYKDRDLKGLRVEHDMDEFHEGKTIILTLKDKNVLDHNDDALVNVNLVDEERYRKNVENRKQKPNLYGYDVYEEQYDVFGQPIERGILGKYDEEIAGAKKKTFTIGESMDEQMVQKRRLLEIKTKLAGKRLESLDETIVKPAVDTYSEAELTQFKKPKKKNKKLRQKLKPDDLLPLPGHSENGPRDFGKRRAAMREALLTDDTPEIREDFSNIKVELDLEDEDDLQKALSKALKLKQKENIIRKPLAIDPVDIKMDIKSESESDEEIASSGKDGNITLNATAEFCRTLGDIPTYGMAGNREVDSNDIMDFEVLDPEPEAPDNKPAMSTGTWNSVNPDSVSIVLSEDNSNDVSDIAILDEEPDVGAGVAAALRLALSKGYLEKEDKNRPSNSKMAHLQAKNYSIEDKAYGDEDKFGRRDRYHAGPIMEFKERDSFKPNVKLEYIDDNGRILNAKEAFRYLSHKFHGKGPGKNKIEKRLKKMEQEGLMKKMSSTDTPLGTLSMLQQKQKETQAPYVVLSGGKQSQVSTSIAKHK